MKKELFNNQISVWDISFTILIFFTMIIVTTAILFILNIPIGYFNIILAVCFTALVTYYFLKKSSKDYLIIMGISGLLVLLCILSAMNVYDNTWDGAAYHKQAVGLLGSGWNPLFYSAKSFESFAHTIPYISENPLKWAEAYPKSTWYFAAAVNFITGNIESGKAYTIIMLLVTFGVFYDYVKSKQLKRWQCILIPVLAAINPISLTQVQSYYLDGMAASVIMSLMILFISDFDEDYNRDKKQRWIMILCLIIIGCTVKFSILMFVAIYCLLYFLYASYKNYKKNKNGQTVKLFLFFIISSLFSILVVGASPFITNTIRYHNPFYGVLGNSSLLSPEGMASSAGIPDKSNFTLFFVSLFGKMSHGTYHTINEVIKLPFTFSMNELSFYNYVDTRISGLGIFFSGIFVISVIALLIINILQKRRKGKLSEWNTLANWILLATLVFTPFLPGSSQMRYVGYIYFIPVFSVFSLFLYKSSADGKGLNQSKFIASLVACFISLAIFANAAPWAKPIYSRIKKSYNITATLKLLSNLDYAKNQLNVSLYCYDFTGMYYNLNDFGIKYNYVDLKEMTDRKNFNLTYFDWLYYEIMKK